MRLYIYINIYTLANVGVGILPSWLVICVECGAEWWTVGFITKKSNIKAKSLSISVLCTQRAKMATD